MKTFEEFNKSFEGVRQITKHDAETINKIIRQKYKEYKNYHFNQWLSKIDTATINKAGIKSFREIWETMDYCDR